MKRKPRHFLAALALMCCPLCSLGCGDDGTPATTTTDTTGAPICEVSTSEGSTTGDTEDSTSTSK